MFGLPNLYLIGGVALVIAALTGWALWERHDAIASAKGERAALDRMVLAQADAARWQQASQHRDGVIVSLTASLDEQSAAIAASRAKEAELRKNLDSARQQNDRLQEQANQLSKELDDEAAATPGDVRELGPIVTRRAQQLFN
jgi:chromosome segregation ATPase